jgi:RNA polymerase sigma factor (sigma-70 family)
VTVCPADPAEPSATTAGIAHEGDCLAQRFEENRAHLRAVAYRMLGSLSEAEDAVQESWLRLSRHDVSGVENLTGWLTTVLARVCLDMLRSRTSRREEPLGVRVPEPTASRQDAADPEQEAVLADSVGLALLVVLDTLGPAERLVFVLHDMFAVPFDEIAPLVDRSPAATRQLASRARRRIQGADAVPDAAHTRQREVVEAFLAASRKGDFDALLTLLDPDVTARADARVVPAGAASEVHDAPAVAKQALAYSRRARHAELALVNGAAGIVVAPGGRLLAVMTFAVRRDKIVEVDIVADPARLCQLDLAHTRRMLSTIRSVTGWQGSRARAG